MPIAHQNDQPAMMRIKFDSISRNIGSRFTAQHLHLERLQQGLPPLAVPLPRQVLCLRELSPDVVFDRVVCLSGGLQRLWSKNVRET